MLPRYASYLKNILYREPSFILEYYLFHRNWETDKVDYVFMADGKMVHGGLFDRLKGAISIYALSKVHHKRFGIYFKEPFELSKYLQPASYDWVIDDGDVIFCFPVSRPIIAYSENSTPRRLLKKRFGQTHFYFGGDILGAINQEYGTQFDWGSLFHELFSPSVLVQDYVAAKQKEIASAYNAVHIRFVNMLGDQIERINYPEANAAEKEYLLGKCCRIVNVLLDESHKDGRKLLVASDSMLFLDVIKKKFPYVYIVPGTVRHIDNSNVYEEDNMKLFADLFLLAGAKNVYSIIGKGLYPSAFPKYSAKIGNRLFQRISL